MPRYNRFAQNFPSPFRRKVKKIRGFARHVPVVRNTRYKPVYDFSTMLLIRSNTLRARRWISTYGVWVTARPPLTYHASYRACLSIVTVYRITSSYRKFCPSAARRLIFLEPNMVRDLDRIPRVDNSCLFLYAFPWFLRRWRTCSLDEAYRISKIITAEQNPIAVPNKIYRACMRGWSLQAVQPWWTRGFERPVVRHSCLRCFRWKLRDNAILGWKLSSSPYKGHCNVLNRGKPFAYIRWIWNLVRRIFSI